eukprot:11190496-Ditylum_brightwellii.AAC.1
MTSIETLYGGWNHGHLGLVINPARYFQEARQNFMILPRPPMAPAIPRHFMSQADMDLIRQDHKAAIMRYYTALNVDKPLKKQLTKLVHLMHTGALHVLLMEFTNAPTNQIIQHLHQNYGHVSPTMLANADARL